jgi:hypothetical protein
MKISALIIKLESLKTQHGDIDVFCDSLSHSFPPDLAVRKRPFIVGDDIQDRKVVVLNS